MKAYNGTLLRVDLTEGKCKTFHPEEDYYKRYLGGRGFIVHTLLTEVPAGIDPLGPDNKLIFALGPITGFPIPGSGRNSVGAKSPLTGGFGESEAGGYWGSELKWAGFDAIIVEGESKKPVFLWINNGSVEIRDASGLWGLDIYDTDQKIKAELDDRRIRTAIIGPAGENLVLFASIANDVSHVAGRMGMGAVMGSKKLKAIAVRGNNRPEAENRQKLVELSKWMGKNFKSIAPYWRCGTGTILEDCEENGNLPIRNFSGGRFPNVYKTTAAMMVEKGYLVKMDTCFSCPIKCKKRIQTKTPWEVIPEYGGPEYETLAAFGANCGIDNLEAIIKAHEICNKYVMDTISAGVTISFAMECFEKGILKTADTNGIEVKYGDADCLIYLLEEIAFRRGVGALLADGSKNAAAKIGNGASLYAMHVKGLEIPMHEPRYKQGMALHYSIHAAGADHNTAIHDDRYAKNIKEWEPIDLPEEMHTTEMSFRKTRMIYHLGLWRHLFNMLGLCLFVPWTNRQMMEITEAATGWSMSYWRLMKAAERGITLMRIYNLREGLSSDDDVLPLRFFNTAQKGPLKDIAIDEHVFLKCQQLYYGMLGWNEKGIPTENRMTELGIEWAGEILSQEDNSFR